MSAPSTDPSQQPVVATTPSTATGAAVTEQPQQPPVAQIAAAGQYGHYQGYGDMYTMSHDPQTSANWAAGNYTYNYYAAGGWGAGYSAVGMGYGVYGGAVGGAASALQFAGMVEDDPEDTEIPQCHLHTKPVLDCKLCRKYKGNLQYHARRAILAQAVKPQEEKKHMVEMNNTTHFNVNNLLHNSILGSEYYKSLYQIKTFNEVVDEIYEYAKDAEPYCAGSSRAPSTLFCCLFKLMTMRLSERQMMQLLDHDDSPYIRCTGFLYLRYTCPPEKLWVWYESHFLDDEMFTPGADKNKTMTTMGEYIESLITEDKYFNTVLPRLPQRIRTDYGVQLTPMKEHRSRKQRNKQQIDRFVKGAPVLCCSNGDWLESELVDIVEPHKGKVSAICQLEEQEEIDLGLVILKERDSSPSPSVQRPKRKKHKRKHRKEGEVDGEGRDKERSGKRNRDRHNKDDPAGSVAEANEGSGAGLSGGESPGGRGGGEVEQRRSKRKASSDEDDDDDEESRNKRVVNEYRRHQRDKAAASGKDYARRPTSYKSSLSLKAESGTMLPRRNKSPSPPTKDSRGSDRSDGKPGGGPRGGVGGGNRGNQGDSPSPSNQGERGESEEESKLRERQERLAQLKEQYKTSKTSSSTHRSSDFGLEGPDRLRLGGGRSGGGR
eukprot:GHVN01005587.1.p1 GENE.GHVN01005587.1~~GHVN01005587.1.p1  ORF type:complete len:660 (+),score=124.98 GHVN01005587.1:163-2142(+)